MECSKIANIIIEKYGGLKNRFRNYAQCNTVTTSRKFLFAHRKKATNN